jgi:hypothetical protein
VIYPHVGHGGIFQYHQQFVEKALEFLAKWRCKGGGRPPGLPRGGVNLPERMIDVSGVELCSETFGDLVRSRTMCGESGCEDPLLYARRSAAGSAAMI